MCGFPSWYMKKIDESNQAEPNLLWCTDALLEEHNIEYEDGVGHEAVEDVWKVKEGEGWKKGEGFPCPPEIAKDIRDGKMKGMMKAGGYKSMLVNKNGELHSIDDQLVVIWVSGSKEWYCNSKLHRDGDKPAVEWADGSKFWYDNGQKHRGEDKPAIIWADGTKRWYYHNVPYIPSFSCTKELEVNKVNLDGTNGTKYYFKKNKAIGG